jgi:DamX protein
MSALAHAIESEGTSPSVTTISANARVDYILRFSKQAVLVVDENPTIYSQVATHFLGHLAADHNAAFIAISPKFNDIQIRCRVIEQLFPDTLFDPEESLAVSLINLAKQEKKPIDIVVEHVQFLSLQLLHELTQLAEIAKKAQYAISILMLGTLHAGLIVANNKTLFDKKLAILSGQTGQLLALNSKLYKIRKPLFQFNKKSKWLLAISSFTLLLFLAIYALYQTGHIDFNRWINSDTATESISTSARNDIFVLNAVAPKSTLATRNDIFLSLTAPEILKQEGLIVSIPAQPIDIMNAIAMVEPNDKVSTVEADVIATEKLANLIKPLIKPTVITAKASQQPIASTPLNNIEEMTVSSGKVSFSDVSTHEAYFQRAKSGFVIQMAGFTQWQVYHEFITEFEQLSFYKYSRLLYEKEMLVLTSQVYSTRLAADYALTQLPSAIIVRQPWVKSVEVINNEINTFKRSQ